MNARGGAALLGALLLSLALVGAYVALGGGTYKPLEVADPCDPRPLPPAEGLEEVGQQVVLSALDGAACELRVTREDLVLALATPESRAEFARAHRIGEDELEQAVRSGLERAVRDARRAGRLSDVEAALLGEAVARLPISLLIDAFRTGRGLSEELLGRGLTDDLLDAGRGLAEELLGG